MHVRTPFLPPPGAPLVCRLDHGGREIVVEGVVSWQRDVEGGGEFGVQFTALDSGSVEALKGLCGLEAEEEAAAPTAAAIAPATPEPSAAPAPAGMPVKLHINGLGAPMKARVRNSGSRRLQVGSNLEFLKVGRNLEVEDVEHGERRGARIDAVSIQIDPQTQVPQLIVALRYDGQDTTPEPSVIGEGDESPLHAGPALEPLEAVGPVSHSDAARAAEATDADDDGADDAASAAAMRGKVDAFAVSVGNATKTAGERLAVAGGSAAQGFAKWAKASSARIAELARQRKNGGVRRRSTAPAPASSAPSTQRRLRPQNTGRDAPEEIDVGKRRKVIAVAGASAVLFVAIGAFALASHAGKDAAPAPAAAAAPLPPLAVAPPPAMAAAPNPASLTAAPNGGAVAALAPGSPGALPQPGSAETQRPGVIANVPLFGPTPMATLEPAPLGPSPDEISATPANAAAHAPSAPPAPHATEGRMDEADAKSASHDEAFDDGASKKGSHEDSAESRAADVKSWGQGTMHLPLVHRLKLDHPGTALEGKREANGFSVVIPGRKVQDGASTISKRDDRIADVKTKNGPGGARITFIFRGKVPGYKIRLRKSDVEFFISSPENTK
jgi:urease beta subunit